MNARLPRARPNWIASATAIHNVFGLKITKSASTPTKSESTSVFPVRTFFAEIQTSAAITASCSEFTLAARTSTMKGANVSSTASATQTAQRKSRPRSLANANTPNPAPR